MSDIIRFKGHAYVLATSPRVLGPTLTLKEGDSFAVLDRHGDTMPIGGQAQGVYHKGARVLSHHELRLGRQRPLLLSSTVHERNAFIAVDLTNPDIAVGEDRVLQRGSLHLFRSMFLLEGALYCKMRLHNYGDQPLDGEITLLFDADFADVFEARGMTRTARGQRHADVAERVVTLLYDGLDGIIRRARLEFSQTPAELSEGAARFLLRLSPRQSVDFLHTIGFEPQAPPPPTPEIFQTRQSQLVDRLQRPEACSITTANEQFNHWISRSSADLAMLISHLPQGPYPYAGVPWFSTVFGRDGLIAALQVLWLDPPVARGVLSYLAAHQADAVDPSRDAEPGKILHEARQGEMSNLGEVPYQRYYGSADATPLFVMLAAAYWERSGDDNALRGLWPAIEKALRWIDTYGDRDGDGFIEYARERPDGLYNQGWKDSEDSVSHADGSLARLPIALCEVQAYVYAARRGAARLAHHLGHVARAVELEAQAERLRRNFEDHFWLDDLGTYALALDGDKKPCRVASSNAGHVLYCGIATPERAARVAESLTSRAMFSGWGVRTLGADEARYNPMSYHNGSIWPHDNALVAAGLARYGLMDKAQAVLSAIFDAALFVDLLRLPELFCGFPRLHGQGPTLYPVACIPQAWSSGAPFMLLQACLGLRVEARRRRVVFDRPTLPPSLTSVGLRGLKVADAEVDLLLSRHSSGGVGVDVLRRRGEVEVRVAM